MTATCIFINRILAACLATCRSRLRRPTTRMSMALRRRNAVNRMFLCGECGKSATIAVASVLVRRPQNNTVLTMRVPTVPVRPNTNFTNPANLLRSQFASQHAISGATAVDAATSAVQLSSSRSYVVMRSFCTHHPLRGDCQQPDSVIRMIREQAQPRTPDRRGCCEPRGQFAGRVVRAALPCLRHHHVLRLRPCLP